MLKTPNTLVLVKRSSYDHYFGKNKISTSTIGSGLPKSDIKRFKETHVVHYASLKHVESILKKRKIPFHRYFRSSLVDYRKYDLIITVGGDGTFMEASHHLTGQVILGVNSDTNWSVGRFCASNAMNFESYLNEYLNGSAHIQLLQRFELKLTGIKHTYQVLNDILACHRNPAAISRYYLTVNDRFEEQRSSGVWIATAAGSTGAIQSAGGIVLPQQSRQIQYKPRELYQGFGIKYALKGALLNPMDKLTITSLIREGVVYVDGCHICLPFSFGAKLQVALSKHPLKMIWK